MIRLTTINDITVPKEPTEPAERKETVKENDRRTDLVKQKVPQGTETTEKSGERRERNLLLPSLTANPVTIKVQAGRGVVGNHPSLLTLSEVLHPLGLILALGHPRLRAFQINVHFPGRTLPGIDWLVYPPVDRVMRCLGGAPWGHGGPFPRHLILFLCFFVVESQRANRGQVRKYPQGVGVICAFVDEELCHKSLHVSLDPRQHLHDFDHVGWREGRGQIEVGRAVEHFSMVVGLFIGNVAKESCPAIGSLQRVKVTAPAIDTRVGMRDWAVLHHGLQCKLLLLLEFFMHHFAEFLGIAVHTFHFILVQVIPLSDDMHNGLLVEPSQSDAASELHPVHCVLADQEI